MHPDQDPEAFARQLKQFDLERDRATSLNGSTLIFGIGVVAFVAVFLALAAKISGLY